MIYLTEKGTDTLLNWLSTVVDDFENHSHYAWISHAEAVAMSTHTGDDVVIEVRSNESLTGRPETLKLSPKLFFTIEA